MTNSLPVRGEPAEETSQLVSKRPYIGWLAIVYWAALFVATHIPIPQLPMADAGSDKVVHVVAFAGLGFLTALWLAVGGWFTVRHLIGLLAVLFVYAAFDEWLQQFVNRQTDPADWVADVIGATMGVGSVFLLQAIRPLNRVPTRDFANPPARDYDEQDIQGREAVDAVPSANREIST